LALLFCVLGVLGVFGVFGVSGATEFHDTLALQSALKSAVAGRVSLCRIVLLESSPFRVCLVLREAAIVKLAGNR